MSETLNEEQLGTEDNPVDTYDASHVGITKRITCERVLGRIKQEMIPARGEPAKWLFSVIGEVRDCEHGVSTYGPFLRLLGEFIANNYLTGEELEGPVCILPDIGTMVVETEIRASGLGRNNGPTSITFAMEVGVMFNGYDETNDPPTKKYQWAIRPKGMRRKSPLRMAMERLLPRGPRLLAAPTAELQGAELKQAPKDAAEVKEASDADVAGKGRHRRS